MKLALLLLSAALFPPVRVGAATFYVSSGGSDGGPGSLARPWRTIQHAADSLKPGDSALVGAGIYRESVEVRHGGTEKAPITIAAQNGARVVVTGADRLDKGWERVPGTTDPIFRHDWGYVFPIGSRPDGSPQLTHPGDLEHEVVGRAEQVISEGRLLRQVLRRDQLSQGTFYVDLAAKKLYLWLMGSGNPAEAEVEASTRDLWLAGAPSVSYVNLRGIRFRYAANHAQHGGLVINPPSGPGAGVSRGWVVSDCVMERANSSGGSFTGEGHTFLRCTFKDNGQLGFGTSRCDNTRMVECTITRNNTKGYSVGWEAGGLKVTMSRGFVFDRCTVTNNRGTGIWYDIGNEKSEVKGCTIADNDDAGIFYEISYGLHAHDNLIVNNAVARETPGGGWSMAGITLSSSEDCVVEHNTLIGNRDGIALREQDRTTPRIDAPEGRQEVRILNRGHMIRANLVAYSQAYNVAFWLDTNFFGPHPSGGDANRPVFEDPKTLGLTLEGNLLWPLPSRPNYLYGAAWRPKSRQLVSPADFAKASGIPTTDKVADPRLKDVTAGDYTLLPGSPAKAMGVGMRGTGARR
ncbi:MAG TPA: right-handed parallel beta-helix repeat-containing protein [Armatimonadota bacterium]|jgi:parallel beta-helix repeat protein